MGYIAEFFRLLFCCSGGSKGTFASGVFLRRLMGSWGTHEVAQNFAYGKYHSATAQRVRSYQRGFRTRHSAQECAVWGCERRSRKLWESNQTPKKNEILDP